MSRLNPFGAVARRLWAGLATAAAPGLRLWLRRRARRGKEALSRLEERRGIDAAPRPPGRILWLHAASVGETAAVLPVLPSLLDADESLSIVFTTGTLTAAQLLMQRLEPERRGRVIHRFVPLDVPAWVRRFLDHWRPDAAALVESEIWPNLLAACRARQIPVMLLNARMSDRSFARWRRSPGLARSVLADFAGIQARSAADADRFRTLGARQVAAPGDLKLAAPPLPVDWTELQRLQTLLAGRPVWLAASTHPGEEALIFAVHRMLAETHPRLLTIIAPRHPERGAEIAAEAAPLPVARRASREDPPAQGIWLADTLGELGLWYRLAPIAFVGRSLLPPGGGQNPLEPARLGCAVAVGPHTGNFSEHVDLLRKAGALTVVPDASSLARFVSELLADPQQCAALGRRATAALQAEADVVDETAAALRRLLGPITPVFR